MHILVFAAGILLFIGLVLVHEWGHYIMARRNGVDVEEFGLGFPPRLWGRKLKSGMMLSLNLLPLGGFVKLKGENDSDERKGSLGAASLGTKTKVMLAGVTMNLLAGLLLLTILAWVGMPKLLTKDNIGQDQFTVASDTKVVKQQVLVGAIQKDSPAQRAGLKPTDSVISISNGSQSQKITTVEQLHDATTAFAGQAVTLTLQTDNQTIVKKVNLLPKAVVEKANAACVKQNNADLCKGYLGVEPNPLQIQRSTWSAPVVAVGLTGQIFKLTFVGLGHALGGLGSAIAGGVTGNHQARENGQDQASSQVGGPVAIGYALWNVGNLGFNFMLFLIALISLTLALMNVLPIPALDGGRLFMMLVSRGIFRRPLSRLAEERIVGASFLVLLLLIALITFVDVKRFF